VTTEARTDAGASAYRGFLFSDMRGFTAYAERHGNAAAAAAVSRFLELARKAIAKHDGSEVNTEGDAIHAVFPSASSAVLCGLEIVDAAATLNAQEPDRQIGLGVGVHAGEAVETAEGYIGRAVNIAARLCAAARPGEVLVSSTVKGITQSSIPVGFIPRGRRRLKGIADPILVSAVTRDPNAKGPREVPRPIMLGSVAIALVAVIAGAALAGSQLLPKPAPTAAPTLQPAAIGALAVGSYTSTRFQPRVTFEIKGSGWSANSDTAGSFGLIREEDPPGNLAFLRVRQVLASPCLAGGGDGSSTGPATPDVLAELAAIATVPDSHIEMSQPQPAQVGGIAAKEVDITVSQAALAACGGLAGADVSVFDTGGEVWGAVPGERFRLIAVTVGDQPVTIVISSDWSKTPSVQQLEQVYALAQVIIDSVVFPPS
jgi:class 3 adenylate cyclase